MSSTSDPGGDPPPPQRFRDIVAVSAPRPFRVGQPLTSKLAIVAACMDDFLRLENDALFSAYTEQININHRLVETIEVLRTQSRRVLGRVTTLEFDLEDTLDRNERLLEYINTLEVNILSCPTHSGRDRLFRLPPNRQLVYPEVVDLTTEEELDEDEEDREE